ncbi:HD-GYP domain-containing protein [Fuchsiella alkaliacetigena]|uniref:HD-GYP domain-containing protein n=1 Tax=Fuchsiella alkaliacetigena TaxID=957042 RepID=UPI00200A9C3E|nr:HD-GYP domain-containing protein [Fuchsiella alkaliacetigena]MCK8825682.1 HD-GYP domain-containing protein [Fuchsiella alkaliacetigena]
MQRILVENLTPGQKVARTIYNSEGNVLISAGMKLEKSYINRLQSLGIESIYIVPAEIPLVDVPDPISDETRMEAVKTVREIIKKIKGEAAINSKKVQNMVSDIIDEILLDENKIVHLNDIRSYSDYIFHHSVNVAVLSLLIAMDFSYNREELRKLGLGALLHDVGMTFLDQELGEKDKLSREEHSSFKEHTVYGYQTIKEIPGVHIISAHVAYQHHEKLDGTGYPRGLKKEDIVEPAQLVAVANVYDALTSDGNALERLKPQQALKILTALGGHKLSFKYVEALTKHIAKYPVGSLVILNSGETALVLEVDKENLSSPVVKVLKDKAGNRLAGQELIDLRESEGLYIKELLD